MMDNRERWPERGSGLSGNKLSDCFDFLSAGFLLDEQLA